MDVLGPRTFLKLVGGATLLVADHQVFVAGGRPSLLLAALLTAFNLVYVLACFPQLMVCCIRVFPCSPPKSANLGSLICTRTITCMNWEFSICQTKCFTCSSELT